MIITKIAFDNNIEYYVNKLNEISFENSIRLSCCFRDKNDVYSVIYTPKQYIFFLLALELLEKSDIVGITITDNQ